jgi:hypothetical protein
MSGSCSTLGYIELAAPDFGTAGSVGASLVRIGLNGTEHDEAKTAKFSGRSNVRRAGTTLKALGSRLG